VQRYGGESLGEAPRIVVLGSCKLGNYVKSTPLLRGLKQRWPAATVEFLGSGVTADFESHCPWIDWRISWDDPAPEAGLALQQALADRLAEVGPVDLAINLDGFNPLTQTLTTWLRPRYVAGGALTANLRRELPWGELPQQRFLADPDWDSPAFLERYAGAFHSNYIAELFCRLAFIDTDFEAIELPAADPGFDVPEVLIHCTTARAAKIWPFAHWRQVVEACTSRGIRVGLVGSPPAAQRAEYHADEGEDALLAATELIDLRGRTSLMQLAGACRQAAAVVSVDAGPMHIAAAVGTPTLAVVGNDAAGVGASPIRLWLPRVAVLQRTESSASCSACADNRYRNDGCLVEGHPCMAGVGPEQVIDWLARVPALRDRWTS
jgi:ADP-heptose:LPS heptosyltransferase